MPERRAREAIHADQPTEQLLLTKDHTDYCWYSTTLNIETAGPQELVIPYGGDYFYVYLDGKLAGQTVAPLKEDRGPITPDDPAHPRVYMNGHKPNPNGYRHVFNLADVSAGPHRLDLLATALGMIKGDWMIDSPMSFERKGIWEGVQLQRLPAHRLADDPVPCRRKSGRRGKGRGVDQPGRAANAELVQDTLSPDTPDARRRRRLPHQRGGTGQGHDVCERPRRGAALADREPGTGGQPTQQCYLVPRDWLRAENTLVIFEEQAALPANVQIERRSA